MRQELSLVASIWPKKPFTFHPIPTKMPSEVVFMRGRVQALLAWTI